MKANEAPDKIYLQVCGDCPEVDCRNCKFEDLEDNITWCKDKIFEKDVEYTRTDAFIEKACEWLENHNDYQRVLDNGRGIRFDMTQCVIDFRKAMKGNKL